MKNSQTVNKIDDKKEILGWAMYDWSISAYDTTVVVAFFGPYITAMTKGQADINGLVYIFGVPIAASSFYPYIVAFATILQVCMLPLLGAIADYSALRKQMLVFFTILGAGTTILMYFISGSLWWLGGLLFIVTNISAASSFVFYNSFLSDICSEGKRDQVSSYGYSLGYLGGGILLLLNLLLFQFRDVLGLGTELAVRVNLASAGIWWISWSMFTFKRVKSREKQVILINESYISVGIKQLVNTLKHMINYKHLLLFLLAYIFYNDGIQTIINVAALYAVEEVKISQATLLQIILMIQVLAFPCVLFMGYLAKRFSPFFVLIFCISIYCGITIFAYAMMNTELSVWILGAMVAFVQGGAQAISRSVYTQMIPKGSNLAEYFSFFDISIRGTAWMGPLVFGLVNQWYGSMRLAILSLIIFFIVGLILLCFVNIGKGIAQSKMSVDELS